MPANDELSDAAIQRALALNRYSAGKTKDIFKILVRAERDVVSRLSAIFNENTVKKILSRIKEFQKIISDAYKQSETVHAEELQKLAVVEAAWQIKTINKVVGAAVAKVLPTVEQLAAIAKDTIIVGNVASDWWAQQSIAAQNEFKRVVRLGMSQSETNQQITKRVKDAMGMARRNAESLVRTATQSVSLAARDAAANANEELFEGKMSLAVLDGRTTFLCASYDHAMYTLDNIPKGPNKKPYIAAPRHFRCRSLYTYVLKAWDKVGLSKDDVTPGMRSSLDGQVPASTTFEKYLSTKPKAWQEEYLGRGRYELWKAEKITLSDLIDGTGREIKLTDLEKFN